MTNAGRIGFLIKGDYDPAATYDFLDVVFYDHASYVAKKLTTGNAPVRNNEYWQVLAEGGTLTENSDISDTTITFTEAENRVNVASGDTAGTFAGKVKKFFSDLKNVAFSGKYSDLTGTPGDFTGASATLAGSSGLVPAPGAGKNGAFLRGDKTWQNLGAAAFAGLANNVLTTDAGSALDARQGKALQDKIDELNSASKSRSYINTAFLTNPTDFYKSMSINTFQPVYTSSSTTGLPTEDVSNWHYATGFIIKRNENEGVVVLFKHNTGEVGINTYSHGAPTTWRIITPI